MSNRGVRIIGMGAISAIGHDVPSTLTSLLDSRSGIAPMTICHSDLSVPAGEVKMTDEALASALGIDHKNQSRTALLAMTAAREAIASAGLTPDELTHTALISATTTGGMNETPQFYKDFATDNSHGRLRHIVHHPCADHTDMMANTLGIGGWRTTISTACSSGANAILTAAMMIEAGMADTVIAGGADTLCRFTLGGFNSLKILSREPCHPLSEGRDGLNLGEGAAYVVLSASDAHPTIGWLAGWHNANDAHHQTAMSDDGRGAQDAMRGAMSKADVTPQEIGYINLHGTATPNNDQTEVAALRSVWGDTLPPFGSTKGLTGHTLAAAGALEAVFCLLGLQKDVAWKSAGLTTPMVGQPVPTTANTPIGSPYALSNSLGFGGNCTSLIFKKA